MSYLTERTQISRSFKNTLAARLEEKSPLIQVLIGPRQVGKTTAIRALLANQGIYFSADSPVPLNAEEIQNVWNQAMELDHPLLAIEKNLKECLAGRYELIRVVHPAQIVSLNKIQGMLQDRGALATLQNYLEILSYGFLVSGLQKYTSSTLRTRSSPPKLIVHDNALIRAFERPMNQKVDSSRIGFYLENAIGARFVEAEWDTFYWKDKLDEVDFVVLGRQGEKWAVEVKMSPPSLKELKGLFAFCKLNKDFHPHVVCPQKVNLDGVHWLPAEDVLSMSRQKK